ncbi:hypothetical protein T10_11596 [Trichinella papuae]|uniref:Uncharacterized protein n=1 Tax=Trichinella papuae TaxID=268474 RepID=A0A0V1N1I6_9BILA|nr:hypothetical protein T10_11596 [Trichinella papuae]
MSGWMRSRTVRNRRFISSSAGLFPVVKIRNSLDAVSSFREPFFAKPLLSCGSSSLLVRLMPDETGQF